MVGRGCHRRDGERGKREKMERERRGERREDWPESRLTEASQARGQRRDNDAAIGWAFVPLYVFSSHAAIGFTYTLLTMSDRLRKLLTTHGRAEGTGAV